MRAEWLPLMAAALGVSLAECKKDQGTPHASEVPAPTFKIPPPHDTICSVSVARAPFVVGVGGENGEGVCYGVPAPNPHPSANCGPASAPDGPCADKKPWKPNLRAVVRSSNFEQDALAATIKAALANILPCVTGPWTHHATIEADESGKPKTTSNVACVVQAFDAMTLPGMDSLVIDLTST